MSFHLGEQEYISCDSYESFLQTFVKWHTAGQKAQMKALSVFDRVSTFRIGDFLPTGEMVMRYFDYIMCLLLIENIICI